MIEPILALSFSVYSNKGVYALLLGSGISRSAGIPTGWDIVLDFVRKIARMSNEDCEPDPAVWYKNKFGEEPDYSKLLNELAKSPAERCQLLKNYFEATEEDREKGLKTPTLAHKAIADLVVNKFIKVIITTNFDKLLEKALEEVGVIPIVISNSDSIKGAVPLTHTECTIIKINGDYLDTRIKNTKEELENYDEDLNKLLERIFDEFGLIISGWSGEWDIALHSAIVRCQSHRFTTYWTGRNEPGASAKKLIQIRRAMVVNIKDADTFFNELSQQILVLSDFNKSHALSTKVAVQRLKKYLSDSRYKIEINDLLIQEADRVFEVLSKEKFLMAHSNYDEEFNSRVRRYEALIEKLQSLFITGCFFGERIHENLWIRCLERITVYPNPGEYNEMLFTLYYYPALLLLYSGGIASIAAKNYDTFAALSFKTSVFLRNEKNPLALFLYDNVDMMEFFKKIPGFERLYTPLSSYLEEKLKPYFKDYLPQEEKYRECFDKFEYLLALIVADYYSKKHSQVWGPGGCFYWRGSTSPVDIKKEIELESNNLGNNWSLLKTGAFDGSLNRFLDIKKKFDNLKRNFFY